MRRAAFGLLLVVVWVMLWDGLTWGQVIAGVVVAALVLFLLPAAPLGSDDQRLTFRPIAAFRLLRWFVWQFVLSNLSVVRAVLLPRRWVRTGIVHVELRATSPPLAALVSNITALTPGMQPVDGRPDGSAIDVHVLTLTSEADVRRLVGHLEDLVLAAFDREETSRSGPGPERAR